LDEKIKWRGVQKEDEKKQRKGGKKKDWKNQQKVDPKKRKKRGEKKKKRRDKASIGNKEITCRPKRADPPGLWTRKLISRKKVG